MAFYWYTAESRAQYLQPISARDPVSPGALGAVTPIGVIQPQSSAQRAALTAQQHLVNPYEKERQHQQPERQKALIASQIMKSPVITLAADNTFRQAWELVEKKHVRHVPIVNSANRPVGIISQRDLLREAALFRQSEKNKSRDNLRIGSFMQEKLLSALPTTEIREIARVMVSEHVGAMPIVNEKEELVGIITRSDILTTLTNAVPLELWI